MPRLSSYNARILVTLGLLAALAVVHVTDIGTLLETRLPQPGQDSGVTAGTVDATVEQSLRQYDYASYLNAVENSVFAVNLVIQPKPVVVKKPEPVVVKKLPPPKIQPFTTNLEVTGIAITPERKLVMIWDRTKKEFHLLGENEKLLRWRVVSIDRQRVVLRHERGKRYEFSVNEDTLSQ